MPQLFHQHGVGSNAAMKKKKDQSKEAWESDAVWDLLDAVPAPKAGPRFADNTLRAARTNPPKVLWWKSLFTPAPLFGLGTAAAAAMAFAFFPSSESTPAHDDFQLSENTEEIIEIDNLITSLDQIDELSDSELIALIGY